MALTKNDIRRCAYFKYVRRGYSHGFHLQDWFEAERELRPDIKEWACIYLVHKDGPRIPDSSDFKKFLSSIGLEKIFDMIWKSIFDPIKNFEASTIYYQLKGRYNFVEFIKDDRLTYSNIKNALIKHARKGTFIDIISVGHGSPDEGITLYDGHLSANNIRNISYEVLKACTFPPILRMVYMNNCYGERLIDDWLHAGALAAIGSRGVNLFPVPSLNFFINNWLNGASAKDACEKAWASTKDDLLSRFKDAVKKAIKIPIPPYDPLNAVEKAINEFWKKFTAGAWYDSSRPRCAGLDRCNISTNPHFITAYPFKYPLPKYPSDKVVLEYMSHLQDIGDTSFVLHPNLSGTTGQSRRLEGFLIRTARGDIKLSYMAHLQDIGDTSWIDINDFIGTRGQDRRLEGFAIKVTTEYANMYDVYYMAHLEGIGDTQWFRNGEFCGTRGQSRRLEAISVFITEK